MYLQNIEKLIHMFLVLLWFWCDLVMAISFRETSLSLRNFNYASEATVKNMGRWLHEAPGDAILFTRNQSTVMSYIKKDIVKVLHHWPSCESILWKYFFWDFMDMNWTMVAWRFGPIFCHCPHMMTCLPHCSQRNWLQLKSIAAVVKIVASNSNSQR